MTTEGRCPNCGALVTADAEWCGQCFTRLRVPDADPMSATTTREGGRPSSPGVATGLPKGIQIEDGKPAWTCPACEARNPIEASVCSVCGTPFSRLLEEPDAGGELDPRSAARWSLVLPGLGHWKLGRRGDAVARFAMFGWSFGGLLVLLASRLGKGGLGPTSSLFLFFLAVSVAIYVLSAIDAYRIASGREPIVGSRTLLWISAGLIVLSVLIATFVTLPAARR